MTDPSGRRVTMRDVAKRVGVDVSTVSLALRGNERVKPATRVQVETAALELGYRKHPMIAAWVSACRAGKPVAQQLPLAYITCHPGDFRWRASEHFRTIFEGARDQAARHGFMLTEFRLADYARNVRRLHQVLTTRNIEGIIVGPTLHHHSMPEWDWEKFSLVTIGYGLESPVIHRVTEDHHLGMKMAFEACLNRGYRRIGLAIVRKHNATRRERWIAAYLYEQHRCLSAGEQVRIHEARHNAPWREASRWVERECPDVVLTDDPAAWRDTNVPRLGFALAVAHEHPGVYENNRGIGRHAADLLVSLVLRNERGVPDARQTVLVEPTLFEDGLGVL